MGVIMIKNLEELENWSKFSKSTQTNLETAKLSNLDSIGLLMTKKYNPNEVISFMQSLADPKYVGDIYTKDIWNLRTNQRVRGLVAQIEPYMDNKYSSHAMISLPTSFNGIQFPLSTNLTNKTIYVGKETTCPRFEKLVKLFSEKLNATINFKFVSTNNKYYVKNANSYDVFNQLNVNSNYSLNENDKIVVIASIMANNMFSEYKSTMPAEYASLLNKFNPQEVEKVENVVNDVLTLAIMRATDLGNPEISYKIDEALKLQTSNDLALVATYGNNVTKHIASMVEQVSNNIAKKLDYAVDRIVSNMEDMGFKYTKRPRNALQALFNASNLEKSYGIELTTYSKPKRVMHALSGAALLAGITNLKQELPGIVDAFILTEKEKMQVAGTKNAVVSPTQSLMFILKNKNKMNLFAPVLLGYENAKTNTINKVIDRFVEQREEDFGKSYKKRLNDVLNEEYPNETNKKSRSSTIVKKVINEEIKKANKANKEAKKANKTADAEK